MWVSTFAADEKVELASECIPELLSAQPDRVPMAERGSATATTTQAASWEQAAEYGQEQSEGVAWE